MEWMSGHKDVLPFTAMIIVECINVGSGVFFKAAASRGLSYYVLIVYSYAIATILLLPLLFIFRRTGLPPFKLSLIFKLFLLGIIGFSGSLCVYKGIEYSSPTLASAIGNLFPAFIFILAVTFSMERLNWRSRSTRAKVMGTLVSISGALVVVLYKGPTILSPTTPSILGMSEKEWVKGGLLLTLGYLLFSMWAILQTHIMKTDPDELVLAFLYNLCGTIVSAPTCLIAEKNLIAWRLTPGIPLLATIYSGSFVLSFGILVHIWGMHMKGPVYVASFKPLSIVIAAASSFIFLGDALYLGSVVGAIVLSIGFYAVIWGKAKEEKMNEDCVLPIATSRGLSYSVFIVYSYAIGTILLFPLTFIFRRTELPPFKLTLLFKLLSLD
ncbi:WAT1-related protein At4g15540-like [Rosa rugosa]|uniref:WAT1-related protein At4g15540-like n=1 Tax=Rosa rugosa TaxID=74645 RepID=UPI002B402218|nr:WAT1-related protein At4g15540-like [Rosa rugosa]